MQPRRTGLLILAATSLGSAVVFIDQTVVNVALPALRRDLSTGLAGQQWVVEAYLLTLGSLVLAGGALGDLLGRRRVFAAGVAGFGATSLLCALASSTGWLIGARALQGMAGALLVPNSLAILRVAFDEQRRAWAIGMWTAITSGAIALGPPLGGVLVDLFSWRAIFLLNIPLVLACLGLIARGVPSFPGSPGRRVDVIGAVLSLLGLGGPVFALVEQQREGWGSPVVLGPLLAGIALLAAFAVWEARGARDPMLPLDLFRIRNFAVGNAATFTIYAGLGAATFFVAIFLQQVAGYSAVEGGLALLPITVMMVALAGRFGALSARVGPRRLMGFGPIVAAAGLALFLRLDEHGRWATHVLPAAIVFGLGLAMTVAPLTATVLGAVDGSRAGVASGVNNAVARIAGLVAIAAVGAVVAARFTTVLEHRIGPHPPPAVARAVGHVQARPLVIGDLPPGVPDAERLRSAQVAASVNAFRWGMGVSAALVLAGGLLSLAGIEDRPRR